MGFNSAHGHSGRTTLGPDPGSGLRASAGPRWPGAAAAHGHSRSGHGGKLIADSTMAENPNKLRGNGHWTSAHMPLQENRGREVGKGGAHWGRRFYGDPRADVEEAPVRGRGGWRSGRGGAPWWCGTRCKVGGVGDQPMKATTSETLAEEDCHTPVP
jgi:hypothetical protein